MYGVVCVISGHADMLGGGSYSGGCSKEQHWFEPHAAITDVQTQTNPASRR